MRNRTGDPRSEEPIGFPDRRYFHRDRHGRRIGPVVEVLEGRVLLAGTSPTRFVPVHEPVGTPTPQQLGAAYHQVEAVQTTTLQSLGDSYRQVEAAGTRLASRTAAAIDHLDGELGQVTSQRQAGAISAAIRHDRHILNEGGAHVTRVEQGFDVARGLADKQATTDKIYIPNHLFTTLTQLVRQDRSIGADIARSGRRSANALVRKLDLLANELIGSTQPSTRR